MFKLKLDNVIKVVNSDFEKERLIKLGYVLVEEETKSTEEILETEEVVEETSKSSKKGVKKNESIT